MRWTTLIGIAGIVSISAVAPSARAGIEYPWCAQYAGGPAGGGRNCAFSTVAQCRATISGMGGFCEPNLFYPGSAGDAPRSRRRR
jgi:hypothetical protein